MGIGATHRDYDAAAPQWSRARDVLAGEDAVKGGLDLNWRRSRLGSGWEWCDLFAQVSVRCVGFGFTWF